MPSSIPLTLKTGGRLYIIESALQTADVIFGTAPEANSRGIRLTGGCKRNDRTPAQEG